MRSPIQKSTNEYKLFESNGIVKYGIQTPNGRIMSPIHYKSLMYLLWSNLQQTPGQIGVVEISISELCHGLGYSNDKNFNFSHRKELVIRSLNDLISIPLTVYDQTENMYVSFVWIHEMFISMEKDIISVRFEPYLAKYFGQRLYREFSVVPLKYLNRLNTSTSIIMYQFFSCYVNMRSVYCEVSELSRLLTGNQDYEYKYLKRNHLVPAINSINGLTDLNVKMVENRNGHKVIGIQFIITKVPAEKELFYYICEENVRPDELDTHPYNENWMTNYDYDMSTQEYVPHQDRFDDGT